MRRTKWTVLVLIVVALAAGLSRSTIGRNRPDLAALVSFDGAPLTFEKTYRSGSVGPFTIGESRVATMQHLSKSVPTKRDMELHGKPATWTVILPAPSGGHGLYTLHFQDDRLTSVKTFYSAFAGF